MKRLSSSYRARATSSKPSTSFSTTPLRTLIRQLSYSWSRRPMQPCR